MKNTATVIIFIFFFLGTVSFFNPHKLGAATLGQEKVAYNLPYPGILPDHPLYIFKTLRDKILEFTTRDNLKKGQLYLLFSDKRAATALSFAKMGKDKQAVSALKDSEKYFSKILRLLKASKKQGVSPLGEFIQTLRLSNAKHREVEETLLKTLPQGQNEMISDILKENEKMKKELERL